MTTKMQIVKRLRDAAVQAAAGVSAAKGELKAAKSQLKQARKVFKAEKKAAKQLRRKLEEAVAAASARPKKPKPLPARIAAAPSPKAVKKAAVSKGVRKKSKPRAKKAPTTMRSAAEVAKSVIERLHAPPPLLPTPVIVPSSVAADTADSTASNPAKS
jgi:Sec-independent protein translocase protein TatA